MEYTGEELQKFIQSKSKKRDLMIEILIKNENKRCTCGYGKLYKYTTTCSICDFSNESCEVCMKRKICSLCLNLN